MVTPSTMRAIENLDWNGFSADLSDSVLELLTQDCETGDMDIPEMCDLADDIIMERLA